MLLSTPTKQRSSELADETVTVLVFLAATASESVQRETTEASAAFTGRAIDASRAIANAGTFGSCRRVIGIRVLNRRA